jgi:hypothetical protein
LSAVDDIMTAYGKYDSVFPRCPYAILKMERYPYKVSKCDWDLGVVL